MSEDSPQGQENKQVRATPNTNMLLQFRGTLLATIDAVTVEDLSNPMIRKKYELTRELLAKDKADFTWNDAYQLEKLAVHLRPCVDLKVELKKQLSALRERGPEWAKIYENDVDALIILIDEKKKASKSIRTADNGADAAGKVAETSSVVAIADPYQFDDPVYAESRYFLERILNDLHWASAQRYHCRKIATSYTLRISLVCACLVAMFAIVIAWPTVHLFPPNFSGIVLITFAGLLGAGFSVLTGRNLAVNHNKIEQLERVTSPPVIFLRVGVGGVAAIIIYFFFEAGLIEGILFPDLDRLGFSPILLLENDELYRAIKNASPKLVELEKFVAEHNGDSLQAATVTVREAFNQFIALYDEKLGAVPNNTGVYNFVPNTELSKLMVWGAVAGFSERLVVVMLGQVEKRESS